MPTGTQDRVVSMRHLRRSCRECSLRTLCLPAGIARTDIECLDEVIQSRVPLECGEALFHAGDPFTNVYVVRTGTVRTTLPEQDGSEQVIGFHLPGELLGLEAISDEVHHCDAVALERTSLCMVPFTQLEDVAVRVPGLQHQLHRLISREMIEDQQHLVALGRRTARDRIALFLHSLSERLEGAGYDGADLRLAMSREDIANYLGLALETVSRMLTKLTEDGVLEVDRRRVRIRDRRALAAMAGRPPVPSGTGACTGTSGR